MSEWVSEWLGGWVGGVEWVSKVSNLFLTTTTNRKYLEQKINNLTITK